jgi:hypothetical protein
MAECIHGFEEPLCDTCFPRVVPEQTPAATRARRTTNNARATAIRSNRGSNADTRPSALLSTQRLYHVTHQRNLEAILSRGAIDPGATPVMDVSSATTRELRATVDLANGATVADHAAFYLNPQATRWNELRTGAEGAHWSDEARSSTPAEYVILVVPAISLGDAIVLADGDAAGASTFFAVGTDAAAPAFRRMHGSDPDFQEAEVLTPDAVPFDQVTLIGVANEPARDRIRAVISDAGRAVPKISVFPPWFAPTEAD